ncbi:MAG: hypothetical protein JSS02_02185 [Planctomycetes bacterium]|nr:hypothetical protein [Planctomycetota bacterium]
MTIKTFGDLATSRKAWLAEVLQPWCRQAAQKDLRLAELEWVDVAGKVDPGKTLWFWAWGRFPALVHDEMSGIDETSPVTVTLTDGSQHTGYPDSRESTDGSLVLWGRASQPPHRNVLLGPFSIDEIASVQKAGPA